MSKDLKTGLIITGVIIVILIVVPIIWGAITGWTGDSWGMMGPGMMGGYGWWWFMPIIIIVFWGLVIWGIVALVRFIISSSNSGISRQTDSALEILKTRYARGEISKEEFEERKKDLV